MNANIPVLNSIYRGAATGSSEIAEILPKTDDPNFVSDLAAQADQYAAISAEAAKKLQALGVEPEPVGAGKKLGMKIGTEMSTIMNTETDHLAELMIKGSNMGIVNMTKVLNGNPGMTDDVKGLAQKLITTEQNNIEKLKTYLK